MLVSEAGGQIWRPGRQWPVGKPQASALLLIFYHLKCLGPSVTSPSSGQRDQSHGLGTLNQSQKGPGGPEGVISAPRTFSPEHLVMLWDYACHHFEAVLLQHGSVGQEARTRPSAEAIR